MIWELEVEILEQLSAAEPEALRVLARQSDLTPDDLVNFRASQSFVTLDSRGVSCDWIQLGLVLGACCENTPNTRLRANSIDISRGLSGHCQTSE